MGVSLAQDWAGWMLFVLSFIFPLCVPRLLKNPQTLLVIWLALILHHYVAIHNAFIGQTLGADADAWTFHRRAAAAAEAGPLSMLGLDAKAYGSFLAVAYYLFGPSHFFGQELSIWAFLISTLYFLGIISQLGLEKYETKQVALFGCLPTALLFGSITLRESWQILFFIATIYYAFEFHLKGKISGLFLSVAFAILLGVTHNGLLPFAPFLILTILAWRIRQKKERPWYLVSLRRSLALAACVVIGIASFFGVTSIAERMQGRTALVAVASGDVMDFVGSYRAGGLRVEARTNYDVVLDTSSLPRAALTLIPAVTYYLFAPFPWQVRSGLDIYAALEALLRLILVIAAIAAWRSAQPPIRSCFSLLLVIYFAMTVLWSLGTINYGTAMRHHLVNFWILIIVGLPNLLQFFVPLPSAAEAKSVQT